MKRNIIALVILVALFGCNSEKKDYANADTVSTIGNDETVVSGKEISADSISEKIIKTANMRFRVKDARKTKIELSRLLKSFKGKLVESSVQSDIEQREKTKYKTDSLMEITAYRTEGRVTARVPSEKLDEFTDVVAASAIFVDHQSLSFDDQSLNYLSNKYKAENRADAIKRINKQAVKKSNNVESALLIKDDLVDKKIENLLIDDRTKYSTITLSFYQANTVTKVLVGNDNLSDYRPAFFRRLGLNLLNGWAIFTEMILALSNIWVFVVIGLLVYFGVKYYKRRSV